jgi:glycosyltransferase involved in cell wall biosynthesis
MKISVLMPTHNASRTIRATLDSVLQQTVAPDEILVLDDGSTDDTPKILNSYKPRITVLQEEHKGVATARNLLCQQAQGDLIAFLDSDDIWHPNYLQMQQRLSQDYPRAVASFTGHVNFHDHENYQWVDKAFGTSPEVEVIPSVRFFRRYNEATGPFASMSYCCIPRWVLGPVGKDPFSSALSTAEDCYFFCLLALLGPVVYAPMPLVAYRISKNSLSSNRLKNLGSVVQAFKLIEDRYKEISDLELSRAFRIAFASRRRQYAKRLMGAGRASEARRQLWYSLRNSSNPSSLAKSLVLLLLTHMPTLIQPKWLPSYRDLKMPRSESKETQMFKAPQDIETLRTLEDLDKIRDVWNELHRAPSADIDFFKAMVGSRPEVMRPHVMVLMSGDVPQAILVGRLEKTRLNFKVGYKSIFKPRARVLTIVGGGFMGDVSTASSETFVRELLRVLRRGEADAACFENVKLDSALYTVLRTVPPFIFRDHLLEHVRYSSMRLPRTIASLYEKMSPKHSKWIRRLPRVLERDHPGQLRFRVFEKPEEAEMLCEDADKIARRTYQRALGVGFVDNEMNRRRLKLEAEKGWLHAEVLYIDEEPCAFWITSLYGRTVYLAFTGYDPKYRKYEPGTILFVRMIQNLINNNVDIMNFGAGEAFYKERFSDESWEEATMFIFAPTFKGLLVNSIQSFTFLCNRLAADSLKRLGVLQKLKTRWRNQALSKI